MSINKVYIPEYELEYIGSKPKSFAAAYVDPKSDPDYSENVKYDTFINASNVCHSATDEPEYRRAILIEYKNGTFYVLTLWEEFHLRNLMNAIKTGYVKRWAYVDDLLPKQLENIEE